MYSQQFGTVIQPQTYERSFSPLIVETQDEEEWKVSILPQPLANHQNCHGRNLNHMPSMYGSDCSPTKKRKPLPQVPTVYTTQEDAYYQLNQPAYHPHWQHDHNNAYAQVPCNPIPAANLDFHAVYNHHYQQQQQPYLETDHLSYSVSSPSSLDEPEELPSANSSPVAVPSDLSKMERKFELHTH